MRTRLYMCTIISEDVESQKRGMVVISQPELDFVRLISRPGIFGPSIMADFKRFMRSLPYRVSAAHVCVSDDIVESSVIKSVLFLMLFGKELRIRVRQYSSLNLETQYQLMSFGINADELPITSSGSVKNKYLTKWINGRKMIDSMRESTGSFTLSLIAHPNLEDVLFCRGGAPNHKGTAEMHRLVSSLSIKHRDASSHKEKRDIREQAIKMVKDRNGRFLETSADGKWWVEITNMEDLHRKIAMLCYNSNRKVKAMGKQKANDSSTIKFLESNSNNKRQKLGDGDDRCGGGCQ